MARLFIMILCIMTAPAFFSAADNPDTGTEKQEEEEESIRIALEEVVVTATRSETSLTGVSQHVTVLTETDIENIGATTLSQVLEKRTGVSISDYGPEGSVEAVTIRGSTSTQVLVLVNGVRVIGSHGGADISLIPLENIERIEIVRGGTSALYGADAIGGVINIITRKTGKAFLRVGLENASYLPQGAFKGSGSDEYLAPPDLMSLVDTQKLTIGFGIPIGPLSCICAINGIRAANEYPFIDLTGESRIRENSGLLGCDGSIDMRYTGESWCIDFSGMGLYHEHGSPGELGSTTPDASQREAMAGCTLGMTSQKFFTDLITLDLKGFMQYHSLDYTDPHAGVDSTHTTFSFGCDLTQELMLSDYISLLYGGTFSADRLDSTDMGKRERNNVSGFIEVPLFPSPDLTIRPAFRYDYFSDFGNSLTFRAGFSLLFSDSQSIKGSFSRSFRAPTFNDLYWPADAFAEGNPDLAPEQGYEGDLGICGSAENIAYTCFFFFRYIDEVILWLPGPDTIWRPTNHGKGIYPGFETSWKIGLPDSFEVALDYTFIYSFALTGDIDISDDKRVPLVPLHNLAAQLTYHEKRLMYSISARYEGKRFLSVATSSTLDPYLILDLHLKLFLSKSATLSFSVDNLFDESRESIGNYPLPGFTFRTGFELNVR
ncbi:MAG: TonB-dependent receptor [Spirochaetales bacterium]|nr:TonB-dependent receptor [Spirochaetales bacterium]